MSNITHNELSVEDLEKLLKEKKASAEAEKAKKREQYEKERDEAVNQLVTEAKGHSEQLYGFKIFAMQMMESLRIATQEYANIRKNSKGGFSLRNNDGSKMVTLRRNVISEYDERADQALLLIRDFLETTIKKKDAQTYKTIQVLLERNKAGDLNPARVADLLKIKDNYDDERWIKAMELFTESYREREVSYNIEFYEKDEQGKDQMITLTFASL